VENIPDGVEVMDARTILPEEGVFYYDGLNTRESVGTPSTFSNQFRCKLQEIEAGIWVDCDVYCVGFFDFEDQPYVFAWQNKNIINSAVLKVPSDSALLKGMLALFEPPYTIPDWVGDKDRCELLERFPDGEVHPKLLPWGSVGPRALTALAHKHGAAGFAMGRKSFYPVMLKDLELLFDPDFDVNEKCTEMTKAIHLWNNEIRHRNDNIPPKGSFLYKVWCEGQ
jgi:hypothetical protein